MPSAGINSSFGSSPRKGNTSRYQNKNIVCCDEARKNTEKLITELNNSYLWVDFKKPNMLLLNLIKYLFKKMQMGIAQKINFKIQVPVVGIKYSQIWTTVFLHS